MPEMPPLPDEKPSAASTPTPTEAPLELAPASSPPVEPGPGAAAGPAPSGPLSAVVPSAIANKPAPAGKLAAAVPLEPVPARTNSRHSRQPTSHRVPRRAPDGSGAPNSEAE